MTHTSRIIALMNQKGGVGKTTSAVNLGAALALMGKRTLLVDLDPQAHLTLHLGIDPHQLDCSIYELMTRDDVSAVNVVQRFSEHLHVLPGHVNLAGVETELAPKMVTGGAQQVLKDKCQTLLRRPDRDESPVTASPFALPEEAEPASEAPVAFGGSDTMSDKGCYDFILIDCPPSLGLLTINALVLAREVVVPMQAHFLALQGLSQLLETVQLINRSFNSELVVSGVLVCMIENQTLLAQEVLDDLKQFLTAARTQDVPWRHAKVLAPAVRRNIKLAECPSFGKTVFDYEPDCHGAKDYRKLAAVLAAQDELTDETQSRDEAAPADTSVPADAAVPEPAAPQPEIHTVPGSFVPPVSPQASEAH